MSKILLFILLTINFSIISFGNSEIEVLKDSLEYLDAGKKAQMLLKISNFYYPNKNDSALLYAERALAVYQTLGNERGIVNCNGMIGAVYNAYGMYDTSIALTYTVLDWGEKNDDRIASVAFLELASTYSTIGQFDKAKEFNLKAIAGNYTPAKTAASANLGLWYLENGLYDSAIFYFQGALEDYYTSDTSLPLNKYNIATIISNLGLVELKKGEFEQSIKLIDKSLVLFDEIGNMSSIVGAYIIKGDDYEGLKNSKLQLEYYLKARKLADSIKIPAAIESVSFKLFKYYQNNYDFENALIYHIQYEEIRDSLLKRSYEKSIAEKEVKYKVKEKINRINLLEKEKANIFNNAVIIILSLLLISSIIIFLLNLRRLKHKNAKVLANAKLHIVAVKEKLAMERLGKIKSALHEKSSFIEELQEEINKLSNADDQKNMHERIQQLRKTKILTDDDWEEYSRVFKEIYPKFCSGISNFDELSAGDKRQLIFLKLGLNQKEIASLMGISPTSVKRARQRLSKKIGLSSTKEFTSFIESL